MEVDREELRIEDEISNLVFQFREKLVAYPPDEQDRLIEQLRQELADLHTGLKQTREPDPALDGRTNT